MNIKFECSYCGDTTPIWLDIIPGEVARLEDNTLVQEGATYSGVCPKCIDLGMPLKIVGRTYSLVEQEEIHAS